MFSNFSTITGANIEQNPGPNDDPFGSAPFDPDKIRKHLLKQETLKKKQASSQQQNSSESKRSTVIVLESEGMYQS